MCSTPFGITEFRGSLRVDVAARSRRGAQRLSASRSFAGSCPRIEIWHFASGAQRLSASRSFAASRFRNLTAGGRCVLNAFRHHGVSRRARSTAKYSVPCAQRLSASRSFAGPGKGATGHAGDVLNAFRHHGVSRRSASRSDRKLRPVLNAFRHHGVSRPTGSGELSRGNHVLNAFRHHGVSRLLDKSSALTIRAVLNAFRHHGVSRVLTRVANHVCRGGAQRLSASRSFAGNVPVLCCGCCLCVLNAFRHHGVSRLPIRARPVATFVCSTPFGITEFRGAAHAAGERDHLGAQRLSASRSFAGKAPTQTGRLRVVLNAFRHHGVSRRLQSHHAINRNVVLNAFRHHGVSRNPAEGDDNGHCTVCSTPFGITEVRGGHPRPLKATATPSAQRLSASQRFADTAGLGVVAGIVECSTPFGITECSRTSPCHVRRQSLPCAQRLSASQRFAASRLAARVPTGPVSAQRLSASLRFAARACSSDWDDADDVLNAFRHHRGSRSRGNRPHQRSQNLVLNAFRHHRGSRCTDGRRTWPTSHVLNAFRHHRGSRAHPR